MRVLLVAIVLLAHVTTIAAQFNLGNAFGAAAGLIGGHFIGSSLRRGLGLGSGIFNGGGSFNGGGGFFNGGGNNFALEPVNLIVPDGGFNGFNGGGNYFF